MSAPDRPPIAVCAPALAPTSTSASTPMQAPRGAASPPAARLPIGARAGVAHFSSEQLFGSAVEVLIEHRGAVYRLKQTSLGKLILTK